MEGLWKVILYVLEGLFCRCGWDDAKTILKLCERQVVLAGYGRAVVMERDRDRHKQTLNI